MPKTSIPVEVLMEQLHSQNWNARCEAARLLGQSGDPWAVDTLLPDLNDSDWRVRRNAAQALGALRDKRAVERLLGLLKDRTMTVRQRAIVALGRIKDPRALPALLEILAEGKRESYDASKAIRKFGKKALPEMVKAFERNRSQELLLLLVELKYESAFELLIELLNSNEHSSHVMAIRELGKLGDKRAIPYLMNDLNDSDSILQIEVINTLGILGATEAAPVLLALLKDDELYGPRSSIYRTVTNAFQRLSGIAVEIQNAFPGNYPAVFNIGGAPQSLPEAMGFLANDRSNILNNALSRFQTNFTPPDNLPSSIADTVRKTMEDMTWKFGVMFADANDAKQERVTRLIELLGSPSSLQRAAAALALPWYGDERALERLSQLQQDSESTARIAGTWAASALQKVIFYRKQSGL
jgi:HEAT repeat protein